MKIKELTPWQLAVLESLVRSEIAKQSGDSAYRSSLEALERKLGDSLNTAHRVAV